MKQVALLFFVLGTAAGLAACESGPVGSAPDPVLAGEDAGPALADPALIAEIIEGAGSVPVGPVLEWRKRPRGPLRCGRYGRCGSVEDACGAVCAASQGVSCGSAFDTCVEQCKGINAAFPEACQRKQIAQLYCESLAPEVQCNELGIPCPSNVGFCGKLTGLLACVEAEGGPPSPCL